MEPKMILRSGWAGVTATLQQSIATAGVVGVILAGAALAPMLNLPFSAFLVAGMGAMTVALGEGVLGVQPARNWPDRIGGWLFVAVLGPILAWLSGLVSCVFMWETGLVDDDFAHWMLVPGNVVTWLSIMVFAYVRGASVPASSDNSARGTSPVQSAA